MLNPNCFKIWSKCYHVPCCISCCHNYIAGGMERIKYFSNIICHSFSCSSTFPNFKIHDTWCISPIPCDVVASKHSISFIIGSHPMVGGLCNFNSLLVASFAILPNFKIPSLTFSVVTKNNLLAFLSVWFIIRQKDGLLTTLSGWDSSITHAMHASSNLFFLSSSLWLFGAGRKNWCYVPLLPEYVSVAVFACSFSYSSRCFLFRCHDSPSVPCFTLTSTWQIVHLA